MKILVSDHGLCLEAAVTLARAGHEVGYYTTSIDKHSLHQVSQMGEGFDAEGVMKIYDFYKALPKFDMVAFFDTHSGDEVDFLRRKGYKVWGAGLQAERLELDRWFAKNQMKNLPHNRSEKVVGVANLIEKLQTAGTCWVKCSGYREIETFKHNDWPTTQEQFIAPLLQEYGTDPNLAFILESEIDPAVEIGSDNLIVNGEWPDIKPYGYEAKDMAYIGRFDSTVLPIQLHAVNAAIEPDLKEASTFVSTEVRIVPSKAGFPVDLTIRAPHPPLAAMLNAYTNLHEVIPFAAINGKLLQPKTRVKYAAVLVGNSGWAEEHRCAITFPSRWREHVKFMKCYKHDGVVYTIPSSSFAVLAVGIGQTIDHAIKACKTIADSIHGKELTFDHSALDKLRDETIPEGHKYGIPF